MGNLIKIDIQKMSSNIWNLTHPLRTGFVKLAPGKEKFCTIIRQGRMDKTVTVRIMNYRWDYRVGFWRSRSKNMHVHDPDNYCRTGDKAIIRSCRKVSNLKTWYVRNIVWAAGRQNLFVKDMTRYEKDALD